MKNNVILMKQDTSNEDYYVRLVSNSPEMARRREAKRLRAKRIQTALSIAKTALTVVITLAVVGIYMAVR